MTDSGDNDVLVIYTVAVLVCLMDGILSFLLNFTKSLWALTKSLRLTKVISK
jgi:hypothetical protein